MLFEMLKWLRLVFLIPHALMLSVFGMVVYHAAQVLFGFQYFMGICVDINDFINIMDFMRFFCFCFYTVNNKVNKLLFKMFSLNLWLLKCDFEILIFIFENFVILNIYFWKK